MSTGHNEIVEQRLYAHLYDRPAWLLDLQQALRHVRLYVMLEDAHRWLLRPAGVVVEAGEIYAPMFGPLGSKHWKDEPRDAERQRHLALMMFESNLEQIIRLARAAGAEVMLVSQAKNYSGWPAIGEHRIELSDEQRERWTADMDAARKREAEGDTAGAIAALGRLLEIDDGDAEVYWRLAELHRARGEYERAMKLYRQAHNTTFANFGTTPERNEMLEDLADREVTLWVDMDGVFEAASPDGLVGFNWFIDFLHPNLAGHRLIAETIFAELRRAGLPEAANRWRQPHALPTPEELHAADPFLRVRELRNRVVAEIVSERHEAARRYLDELRRVYPDDPRLPQLEKWAADGHD